MGRRNKSQSRAAANGRNLDRFGRDNAVLILRRSLWQSPRVSALSPAARSLMVELLSMYNGKNNGLLFLSLQDATDRLGFSDWRAAASAFDELKAVGLLTMTLDAYFDIKTGIHSRARSWQLGWLGSEGERLSEGDLPAFDDNALDARAKKRMARRQTAMKRYFKEHEQGKFSAVVSTMLGARGSEMDSDPTVVSTALIGENGENLPIGQMVETTVYLSYQGGVGQSDPPGWWASIQNIVDRIENEPEKLAA